jgi:hypothetical protein
MFGRRDQHALPHQAGGVADLLNMAPARGNGEAIEVGADEYDAGRRRRREDANADRNPGVQSHADGFDRSLNGSFEAQELV